MKTEYTKTKKFKNLAKKYLAEDKKLYPESYRKKGKEEN
jgi:hypothetical protein